MSYKWLKWLILWIPTAVIGIWEYVRHAFLLPYVSMELGNWLAPAFVFAVTLTLVRGLFARLESLQEALKRKQVTEAAFEERTQLARELHDGISQSLFMLSVKLNKLDRAESPEDASRAMDSVRHTVRHVYEDVRQSIAALQSPPPAANSPWLQSVLEQAEELERGYGIAVSVESKLNDGAMTSRQKVELLAIIREAFMNVQKHSGASRVVLRAETPEEGAASGFRCSIEDDGRGATAEALERAGKYGVKMMRERAGAMGWTFAARRGELGGLMIEVTGKGG
ncbi:sensor histidine kinase [Paenibacillus soyae]|uniref:histidine kinase n=1 Tax=Paenibacillus soyae TaxID=2969249 RepID=A0A9X2S6X3_9BACL|nr:histidine kinase [Paenibacillus soyae]MCR2802430.1 histidine kinase [Paenibacillus soyae]